MQTTWTAGQIAKHIACSAHVVSNVDLTLPTTSAALDSDCPFDVLEIGRTHVMIDKEKLGLTADLDKPEGCKAIATKVQAFAAQFGGYIATDESLPYRRAACVAEALANLEALKHKSMLFERLHPDVVGRKGSVLLWVSKADGEQASKGRPPFDELGTRLLTAPAYGPAAEGWDAKLVQLRIFEGGWELRRAPNANPVEFRGTYDKGVERLKATLGSNYGAHALVIHADPDVRMGMVLAYASQFTYPQLALPRSFREEPTEPAAPGSATPPGSAAPLGSVTPPGSAAPSNSATPPAASDPSRSGQP